MQPVVLEAYYRVELLYTHVLALLNVSEPREHEHEHDDKATQLADLLLTVAQVERLLPTTTENDNGETTVLGVTPSVLHRATGLVDPRTTQFHQDSARLAVLPQVEDRLRDQCSELCDVMWPTLTDRARGTGSLSSSSSRTAPPLARQVMELPALLLELRARKTQKERDRRVLTQQLHAQLLDDIARLKELIHVVTKILVTYKQQDQPRVLQTKIEWLVAYSRAMRLRTKVLTSQLLVETYPPEHVELLTGAHEMLQGRRRRALEEREQMLAKLQLYRSADPEYQAIRQEYAAVLRSIEEKKTWIASLDV
ncbi:hypothetical protein Poli38472_012703 [Pythium oligandrum]|uniref:HAUS augmin-like complex subunit 4 n=1 Tax=Pythium oligandrum TaxID=41045 RepID=A0A8K1CG29_PYTOL|nr:hypothetical protein Poli38472_012703 [Pythium oligandrum]|eukprot:TMW61512.1 hypothetical protein Poli38472_012703 [Pythium oligandrum]